MNSSVFFKSLRTRLSLADLRRGTVGEVAGLELLRLLTGLIP